MHSIALLPLLLAAVHANPIANVDLAERQSVQQVNIDLTLPDIAFFTLALSGSNFGSSLKSAGYKGQGFGYNQVSQGVAGLANIFKQARTPLNTYNVPYVPQNSQTADNQTVYNYTVSAAGAYQDPSAWYAAAGSDSYAFGNSASAASAGSIQAFAYSFASWAQDPNNTFSNAVAISTKEDSATAVVIATYNGVASVNRSVSIGVNETYSIGACISASPGAAAFGSYNTTITFPVNGTKFGAQTVSSTADTKCEAGTADRSLAYMNNGNIIPLAGIRSIIGRAAAAVASTPKTKYSLSSVQAAPKQRGGIQSSVTCNGAVKQGVSLTRYRLRIQGSYAVSTGFVGSIGVTSIVSNTASCT